jgi:2-isopropylmalate synthase
MVSNYTGMPVQPNKAIVGANAFAHEAGIHQDGMLKHHLTYEIMRPETVGASRTRLVLGKHSGRHALRSRLAELGYELSDAELTRIFGRFKQLADRKKGITDADLEAIMADELVQPRELYALDGLQVACGTIGLPTASVRLRGPDGLVQQCAAIGAGPVHAAYTAIDQIVGAPVRLLEYTVNAVTEGIDALGEVTVRTNMPTVTMMTSSTRRAKSRLNAHSAGTGRIPTSLLPVPAPTLPHSTSCWSLTRSTNRRHRPQLKQPPPANG